MSERIKGGAFAGFYKGETCTNCGRSATLRRGAGPWRCGWCDRVARGTLGALFVCCNDRATCAEPGAAPAWAWDVSIGWDVPENIIEGRSGSAELMRAAVAPWRDAQAAGVYVVPGHNDRALRVLGAESLYLYRPSGAGAGHLLRDGSGWVAYLAGLRQNAVPMSLSGALLVLLEQGGIVAERLGRRAAVTP